MRLHLCPLIKISLIYLAAGQSPSSQPTQVSTASENQTAQPSFSVPSSMPTNSKSPTIAPSVLRKPSVKPTINTISNSSNSLQPNSYSKSSTSKSGAIGGGAVAGIIISLLIMLLGCVLVYRYTRSRAKMSDPMDETVYEEAEDRCEPATINPMLQ